MKKLLASAAMAAAMTIGGGSIAHATVYTLNVDGCSSGCGLSNYGTVTVTGEGTNTLSFDIELAAGVFFNQAGGGANGHEETFFDLVGNPSPVTYAGVDPSFTLNGSQNIGSHNSGAFGNWDYVINWGGSPQSNTNLPTIGLQSLTYTVTGTGPLSLDTGVQNGTTIPPIYYVVDVATGCNATTCATTGKVGATLGGGVPEPASWAMMIVGFFGMGSILRKRQALATA